MHVILRELERLDDESRQEALTFLERRYRQPADQPSPAQAEVPTMKPGRPISANTRRILECLEQEGPGTPGVVTQRTGIPNTKQVLNRLKNNGHVTVEGRGLYDFVSYP